MDVCCRKKCETWFSWEVQWFWGSCPSWNGCPSIVGRSMVSRTSLAALLWAASWWRSRWLMQTFARPHGDIMGPCWDPLVSFFALGRFDPRALQLHFATHPLLHLWYMHPLLHWCHGIPPGKQKFLLDHTRLIKEIHKYTQINAIICRRALRKGDGLINMPTLYLALEVPDILVPHQPSNLVFPFYLELLPFDSLSNGSTTPPRYWGSH